MADKTGIEWTDSTFNPWMGCTKVSPACDHCYAERDTKRFGRVQWGAGQPRVRTSADNWKKPLQWNMQEFVECPECGWRGNWEEADARNGCCPNCNHLPRLFKPARRRVFCASLADVFDNEVPAQWRHDLFDLILATPNLDWLLLTKRIGNAKTMMADALHLVQSANRDGMIWPLPNVWLGATICNQDEADRDIPKLLAVPATVRFLSIEPLLGPVSLRWLPAFPENAPHIAQNPSGTTGHLDGLRRIDWVIVGGESGPQARPMVLGWAKDIVRQCKAAGVSVLVKQLGANPTNREGEPHQISDRKGAIMAEWPLEIRIREYPNANP